MNTSTNKQVLVCGTLYGQTYLSAIDELNNFEVAALLAKGSDRSIRLSEQRGIELYRHVSDINQHIDIACVAIGGNTGATIAEELLRIGLPVLLEHPVSLSNIDSLLTVAEQNNTYCHINSHFPYIKPVSSFIEKAKELSTTTTPIIISATCNSRTLYSMLDILQRCFGTINLEEFTSTNIGKSHPYNICTFSINSTPCTLTYQKWRGHHDNSQDSPLGHEITVTYPEGILRLGGSYGPCQWFPLIASGLLLNTPICINISDDYGINSINVIQWRMSANKAAINDLFERNKTLTITDNYQTVSWLKSVCRLWTHLYESLGVETIDLTPKKST